MKIRQFVAICIMLSMVFTAIPFETFVVNAEELYETTLIENDFESGIPEEIEQQIGMGEIVVKDVCNENALYIDAAIDGGYTKASWDFEETTRGILNFNFSFCQPNTKYDDNIIFAVTDGVNELMALFTKNGDIVHRTASEENIIIDDYVEDLWYVLSIEIDLYEETYSVSQNDTLVKEGSFPAQSVKGMYSLAQNMNGYALDNIVVKKSVKMQDNSIEGEAIISIPKSGERKYSYTIKMIDSSGNEISSPDFIWSISGDTTGIEIESSDERSAKLNVTPLADNGTLYLTAQHRTDSTLLITKNISLHKENANIIQISGDTHLTALDGEETLYQYSAVSYDQYGNEMIDAPLIWSVEGEEGYDVSVDGNGLVRVSGAMPGEDLYIYICATSGYDENIKGKKKAILQSNDIYFNDTQRMNAVQDSIDFILKYASSPDGTNPLLAGYLSPYTRQAGEIEYEGMEKTIKYTDLSMQFQLFRAMDSLSNMTGDESYRERVNEIYQTYIDKGYSGNNLFFTGNHQSFDLNTGERSYYYSARLSQRDEIEIENRDVYGEPFERLDPDIWTEFCKAYFGNAMAWGFDTLIYNRHVKVESAPKDLSGLEDLSLFDNDAQFQRPNFPYLPFHGGLTFQSSANTLIRVCREAAVNDDDNKMLYWAYNLLKRFFNTKYIDPDTGETTDLFGAQFVSAMYSPGKFDLDKEFPEGWWNSDAGIDAAKSYSYGDRAYNQFADTFVNAGLIPESRKTEVVEAALLNSPRAFEGLCHESFKLAEAFGLDSPEAKDIVTTYTKYLTSHIKRAYDPKTNKFNVLLTNGVDVTGVRWEYSGYWGGAGNMFKQFQMSSDGIISLIYVCSVLESFPELQNEREYLWNFVKSWLSITYGIGDIGDPEKGIAPQLNLGINSTDTTLIRIFVLLHDINKDAPSSREYIKLARVVGNNIFVKQYKYGMFIKDSKLRYIPVDGEIQYVLLLLEQAILGEDNLVPESLYPNNWEHQVFSISLVNRKLLEWTNPELLTWKYRDVYVTEILSDVDEIRLKVGESQQVVLTVLPDDATSKGVCWEMTNRGIVSIDESNVVTANKKGRTDIIAVSRSTTGVESKKIKVIVE